MTAQAAAQPAGSLRRLDDMNEQEIRFERARDVSGSACVGGCSRAEVECGDDSLARPGSGYRPAPWPGRYREHRDRCPTEDALGRRAEEQLAGAAQSLRSNHDEIGRRASSRLQNLCRRISRHDEAGDVPRPACWSHGPVHELAKLAFARAFSSALFVIGCRRRGLREERIADEERGEARTGIPGDFRGPGMPPASDRRNQPDTESIGTSRVCEPGRS